MKKTLTVILGSLILCLALVQSAGALPGMSPKPVQADAGSQTPIPARVASVKVSFTLYEWWLIRYSDNEVLCQIWVEHDGVPYGAEVQYFCGTDILNQWLLTMPCTFSSTVTTYSQCPGFYFHRARVTPGERTISVNLAPPTAYVSLSGCDITATNNQCDTLPSLLITGQEPIPDEQIIRIEGTLDGQTFSCPGSACTLPLPPTGANGITVVFWANSSFGDSSDHFSAQVRVMPWGNFTSPEGASSDHPKWYVNVISSQWQGAPLASCSETWSSFPPASGLPAWLTTPNDAAKLSSSVSYYYLAGALIQQGTVDASDCQNNGLQSDSKANECGLEKARAAVLKWQNQFDTQIIDVANQTNVPAQLLKNVFSRESQFWPGMFQSFNEVGFGQLTDNGSDTVLLWNSSFFSQFCPLVFDAGVCQRGYGNLTSDQQAILRGAMVTKVNAACPDCPTGIDLTQADFSIGIFARSLLANCNQVGQILNNMTSSPAGSVSSYEDLWKFTLVNYNAGPGCLISALQTVYASGNPLTWDNVSSNLDPGCQGAVQYVKDISQEQAPVITPTPTSLATSSLAAHPPTLTSTSQPTSTTTPLPSETAYPYPGTDQTATPENYP